MTAWHPAFLPRKKYKPRGEVTRQPDRYFDDCNCFACTEHKKKTPHTCSTCKMSGRCDGELRVTSLTDHLSPFYVDAKSRGLVDALARECRQRITKP